MCDMGRMRAIAIAASSCVLVAACSSTEHSTVSRPVPVSSSSSSDAVQQYLNAVDALANKLDAARLRAARQGAAAYQREINAEKSAASDPSIAARDAAGFSESCNAR